MKMAMTALAVVFLAQGAPALARAQDVPDRPGVADHDRPHRDSERMGRPPEARPPEARPAPAAPQPAAPSAAESHGGGHWSPGAGGYPGRGGSWTSNHGGPPAPQPSATPPPPAPTPDRHGGDRNWGDHNWGDRNGGDRFNGGSRDGGRPDGRNPDGRGGDQHDRSHDGDRTRDGDRRDWDRRDHDRDRDHYRDDRHDGDRRDWGRYEGDSRSWGRYDWDRRWAGHEDRPRWEHGRYPQVYVSPHRYRGFYWRPPAGYYVRAWGFGDFLPRGWYGPDWFLDNPWDFDLPLPPPGYDWVRVGYDAILVDDYTGRVVQVVRNVFW